MSDAFNLERFVGAQQSCYAQVRRELEAGCKRTHWMWFIFPQVRGLGSTPTSVYFAIASRNEAVAYLAHSLLGARLRECTRLVNQSGALSATAIFGPVDAMKFRSSMTLFARAALDSHADNDEGNHAGNQEFRAALNTFFGGEDDRRTLELLHLEASSST